MSDPQPATNTDHPTAIQVLTDHGATTTVSIPTRGGVVRHERVCKACGHPMPWETDPAATARHQVDMLLAAGYPVTDDTLAAHDNHVRRDGLATGWDEGRASVGLDFMKPVGPDGQRPATTNPHRDPAS